FFGGDPAEILAGHVADKQQIESIRAQLGLDQPWRAAVGAFLKQICTFDFGQGWMTKEKVSTLFATRLPATLTVMIPILLLDVFLAVATAIVVAYVRGSPYH